jgi:hypothetical protein
VTDQNPLSGAPADISHLVRERVEARTRHDWARADALKAQIEAAGWRVTDRRGRSSVSPIAPPNVEVDGEIRYGSAAGVPSVLQTPAMTAWTVVIVASETPERVSGLLLGLRDHAAAGTQVVIVANDPSEAQAAALQADAPDRAPIGGAVPETVRTSARLGYAAVLNIAMQRATGDLVLLADGTARPTGDALSGLAEALGDPTVAAAGAFGLYSPADEPFQPTDLDREPGEAEDAGEGTAANASAPTALEGAWLAFRRADYIELGPFDERFVTASWLDVWWSLRLRAGAEPEGWTQSEPSEPRDEDEWSADPASEPAPTTADEIEVEADYVFTEPRRAVRLELPLDRVDVAWPPDRARLNRRNMYRVLDRFGRRIDLS